VISTCFLLLPSCCFLPCCLLLVVGLVWAGTMRMYYWWGSSVTILFDGWNTGGSWVYYSLSMIALFVLAMVYELLVTLRGDEEEKHANLFPHTRAASRSATINDPYEAATHTYTYTQYCSSQLISTIDAATAAATAHHRSREIDYMHQHPSVQHRIATTTKSSVD
jgi:hypothetical protein